MGEVKILTHYLAVQKGEDISMVYNGTSSGINSSLWAPHFTLPTVGTTLWEEEKATLMEYLDIEDTSLYSMLSEEVRSFCGVDVTNVRKEEEWESHRIGGWERWERKIMGITDSVYHMFQAVTWAKRIAMGDQLD